MGGEASRAPPLQPNEAVARALGAPDANVRKLGFRRAALATIPSLTSVWPVLLLICVVIWPVLRWSAYLVDLPARAAVRTLQVSAFSIEPRTTASLLRVQSLELAQIGLQM